MLFLLTSTAVLSQTENTKVTISFTEANMREVIKSLEEKTPLKFYYVDEWLSNDSISGSYSDTAVTDILDAIFANTIINYYVLDGEKVILTQNNIIYDELPNGFFEKSGQEAPQVGEAEEAPEAFNPVFFPRRAVKNTAKGRDGEDWQGNT